MSAELPHEIAEADAILSQALGVPVAPAPREETEHERMERETAEAFGLEVPC